MRLYCASYILFIGSRCQPAQIADHSRSSSKIRRVNNPFQRQPAPCRTRFNDPSNPMVQNVVEGDIRSCFLQKTVHLIVGAIQIRLNRLFGRIKPHLTSNVNELNYKTRLTKPRKTQLEIHHHRIRNTSFGRRKTSVCYTAGGAQNVSGPRQTRQELIQI